MSFVTDKKFYFFTCTDSIDLDVAVKRLLAQVPAGEIPLRLVFFGDPGSNDTYVRQIRLIRRLVGEWAGAGTSPAVSYVAQKPLGGSLIMEATTIPDDTVADVTYGDNYIVLDNGSVRELIMGGVLAGDLGNDIYDQATEVFEKIYAVMMREGFAVSAIVRQWNYIEDITRFDGRRQNYQMFNDARSAFYARGCWGGGFPAATGIGTQYGGVMVELNAVRGVTAESRALDNALQVAAHSYSQKVLVGEEDKNFRERTTPKFERARMLSEGDAPALVYISGTAAIRGEDSLADSDMAGQTRITMENIEYLVSGTNTGRSGGRRFGLLRVYVKYPGQAPAARAYMEAEYPDVPAFYVHADICRDELLMEIEGVAVVGE